MIEWHIKDDRLTLKHMEELPDELVKRVNAAMQIQTGILSRRVVSKLSGAVLGSKSGKLVAAIRRGTYFVHEPARARMVGVVGVRGADKKTQIAAGAQEFGASIAARVLEAKDAQALKFKLGGVDMFRGRVSLPAIELPERSFLRSSLDELRPSIQAAINEAALIEKVEL